MWKWISSLLKDCFFQSVTQGCSEEKMPVSWYCPQRYFSKSRWHPSSNISCALLHLCCLVLVISYVAFLWLCFPDFCTFARQVSYWVVVLYSIASITYWLCMSTIYSHCNVADWCQWLCIALIFQIWSAQAGYEELVWIKFNQKHHNIWNVSYPNNWFLFSIRASLLFSL